MSEQPSVPDVGNTKAEARRGKGQRPIGKREDVGRDVSKMIAVASEKYTAGRVKDAVNMLKRVLNAERGNPLATAFLGLCYMRQRRFKEGEKLMARALEAAPNDAEVIAVYAKMLHSVGRMDQAANAYSQAIQLQPENGDLYRELGVLLIDAGVLDQATEALILAVRFNPQDAKAFYHLGLVKKLQGSDAEAIDAYSMATALKPDYAEAHINLAKIAIDNGNHDLGEKACFRALEANPKLSLAYINLCMLKRLKGDFDEAIRFGRKGVELDPISGPAHSNLGNAYMDLHRYQEALASFRKAMEYHPGYSMSYFNCGNALRLLHHLDKANELYEKAIELTPNQAPYLNNQGLVFQEQGRAEEAIECFRKAVEAAPQENGMKFSLGRALMRNGYFDECWDYYDAGMPAKLRKPDRRFGKMVRWKGEDISDKRILVWREQGLGDEIDFTRRYQNIIDVAGQTVIEADKRLMSIFERTFPKAKILPERLDPKTDWARDDCDVHLPAGNLLQYFPFTEDELALKSYPEDDIEAALACGERSKDAKGYLLPDPQRVAEMAERVAKLPEGFRVGICWRSGMSHRDRDIHYTRLEMWEPIFRIPGLVFVNLFYDECEEEITDVEERFGVKIHRWADIDLRNDMEAAFALTTQVNLVMSTSTSPSRIAEAVGKEIWLMAAGGRCANQPPSGEYGVPHHLFWQRHWKEPWSVLMERMARALEARVKG